MFCVRMHEEVTIDAAVFLCFVFNQNKPNQPYKQKAIFNGDFFSVHTEQQGVLCKPHWWFPAHRVSAFLLEHFSQVTLSLELPWLLAWAVHLAAWSPGLSTCDDAARRAEDWLVVQDAPIRRRHMSCEQNVNLIIFEDCNIHLSVSSRCNLVCIINLFFIKLPAPVRVSENIEPPRWSGSFVRERQVQAYQQLPLPECHPGGCTGGLFSGKKATCKLDMPDVLLQYQPPTGHEHFAHLRSEAVTYRCWTGRQARISECQLHGNLILGLQCLCK